MKQPNYKGFSLLEILLTITLLSILFSILVINIRPLNIISISEDNRKEAEALTIYQALEQYALKNNAYPEGVKNMPNDGSLYICKTSAPNCTNSNQINLSDVLVPTYLSKVPEYSTDTNNSGFYVVKDSNGKIGIGGVRKLDDTTFVKGLESQNFATLPQPIPIITNGLVLHLDAGNTTSYPGTGNTWFDLSGNNRNFTLFNSSFYSFNPLNNGSIQFSRNMPPAIETGGYAEHNGSGALAVSTYLYNNHTTEIWARINDRTPTNYPTNETLSALFVYTGWHSMFYYGATNLSYVIYNGTPGTIATPPSLSIGISGTDIIQSQWFHAVVVRNGNNLSSYINGNLKGTNVINTSSGSGFVSNTIRMGMGNPSNLGFSWHANANVATARMYNRALTPEEVQQNFNASRNRFEL